MAGDGDEDEGRSPDGGEEEQLEQVARLHLVRMAVVGWGVNPFCSGKWNSGAEREGKYGDSGLA